MFRSALRSLRNGTRAISSRAANAQKARAFIPLALAGGVAAGAAIYMQPKAQCAWYDIFWGKPKEDPKWAAIRNEVNALIEDNQNYGPLFVRLAWHASGTYDKVSGTGGSNGATMRFPPECKHAANAGLNLARDALEPIKAAHPDVSYADLWTFAGAVAIETLGGPKIPWTSGRTDVADGTSCPPDGRLPNASKDAVHIRDIFYRMGFNDREIVCLLGAHTLGMCNVDRSGYDGPWTRNPWAFDNTFFTLLLQEPWRVKLGSNPLQFTDSSGELMMLPSDLALIIDPGFRQYVELYAKDQAAWFTDFAQAYGRLLALGVPKTTA